MAKALTDKAVAAAEPDLAKRREMPDAALPGFYLVIQPSGAKSWAVRYRAAGKPRKLTLGSYPALGLAEARKAARAAVAKATEGADPAAEKKAAKAEAKLDPDRDKVPTIVADFLKRHASKNKTAAETGRIFAREVLPKWKDKAIHDVTRRDVIELIDGIADRGAPVMANRVLANVRKLGNWCVSRDILAVSFAAGVKGPTPEAARDRVLTDDELRAFWTATGQMGAPFGPLFRVLLLTAARREEVAGMTAAEIEDDTWTLPAARAKNGRAHVVPLSPQALAALAAQPRIAGPAGFIFTTTGRTPASGFGRAKARLDALMVKALDGAELPPFRLHDLRRTAASNMARLGVALPVVEKLLNHVSGSFGGVAGVYQRHDYAAEKRAAVNLWGAFVADLTEGRPGNVVPLRGAR